MRQLLFDFFKNQNAEKFKDIFFTFIRFSSTRQCEVFLGQITKGLAQGPSGHQCGKSSAHFLFQLDMLDTQ